MTTGIYKITNTINNKCYIGCSINIEDRFKDHKKPSRLRANYKIYRAFAKYGIENFNFEIIVKCPKEYLEKTERFCIKAFNSVKTGYNITEGGYGGYGAKHSEEQKQKWRISRKGIRNSHRTDYTLSEKKIVSIDIDNNVVIFNSIKSTGLETTSISRACRRWKVTTKSNYSQGYFWMLLKDYEKLGIVKVKPTNRCNVAIDSLKPENTES